MTTQDGQRPSVPRSANGKDAPITVVPGPCPLCPAPARPRRGGLRTRRARSRHSRCLHDSGTGTLLRDDSTGPGLGSVARGDRLDRHRYDRTASHRSPVAWLSLFGWLSRPRDRNGSVGRATVAREAIMKLKTSDRSAAQSALCDRPHPSSSCRPQLRLPFRCRGTPVSSSRTSNDTNRSNNAVLR